MKNMTYSQKNIQKTLQDIEKRVAKDFKLPVSHVTAVWTGSKIEVTINKK